MNEKILRALVEAGAVKKIKIIAEGSTIFVEVYSGSDAKAVAYSEISYKQQSVWGIGIHQNTVIAGLESVINGLNRLSI